MKKTTGVGNLTTSFDFSFSGTTPLPMDTLPPETLDALRSGRPPTANEMELLRNAAAQGGSVGAQVLSTLISSGLLKEQPLTEQSAVRTADESSSVVVPGPVHLFEWAFDPDRTAKEAPATYYEALSGRADPARDRFVSARRLINHSVTAIAVAIPLLLIAGTVATGAPLQDIVVFGIGGAIVGIMFKTSFPRTPFG